MIYVIEGFNPDSPEDDDGMPQDIYDFLQDLVSEYKGFQRLEFHDIVDLDSIWDMLGRTAESDREEFIELCHTIDKARQEAGINNLDKLALSSTKIENACDRIAWLGHKLLSR